MSDPLRDLLNTPGENGPDNWYIVELVPLHSPNTFTADMPVAEWEKLVTEMTHIGNVISVLEFIDTDGAKQRWYDVRVIGWIESTPEQRLRARRRMVMADLERERVEREQRKETGQYE